MALKDETAAPSTFVDPPTRGTPSVSKNVCSFHGDTQVLTRAGYQAIRDLIDQVWSRNEYNGQMDWKPIHAQYHNTYEATASVTLRDHEGGAAQTIISNKIHPYFIQTDRQVTRLSEGHVYRGVLEHGYWVDAAHLQAGDRLLNDDSSWGEVVGVVIEDKPLKAYNLTVVDFHTYFVAGNDHAAPVWVNNGCQKYLDSDDLDSSLHLRQEEVETAKRLNQQEGLNVKGLQNQSDGDFIAPDGTVYDAMGMPNAYKYWGNGDQFLESINAHLNKTIDHVVIDLTGSSSVQRQQILNYLSNHPKQLKVNNVIFVGD